MCDIISRPKVSKKSLRSGCVRYVCVCAVVRLALRMMMKHIRYNSTSNVRSVLGLDGTVGTAKRFAQKRRSTAVTARHVGD